MDKKRIFVSSVQSEFQEERRQIVAYIRQDAMLSRYFEPYIFEEQPAQDCSAQRAYLDEVAASDIYLGLFGERYGYEDTEGISPTEREYDKATAHNVYRMVLLKDVSSRHEKEQSLIRKAENDVVRNMFSNYDELQSCVYAALVRYMVYKGILAGGPFDTSFHEFATIDDLDKQKIAAFVELARDKRKFPIPYSEENLHKILNDALHLVSDDGRVTNAALLLFAKDPQKWFVSSMVKCAQFYGTEPVKPISFQQNYTGSVLEIVDQAVAFVMTHIDAAVSDRSRSAQADIAYEIPVQAVTEAIVNAVIHRDYTSTGAVQVMLFRDRLEVWNPGGLPKGLTVEKLQGRHRSMPVNPLLANPVYLAGYIEQIGTGTTDLIDRCVQHGLRRPTFVQEDDFLLTIYRRTPQDTPQDTIQVTQQGNSLSANKKEGCTMQGTMAVTPQDTPQDRVEVTHQVIRLYRILGDSERSKQELMTVLGLSDTKNFKEAYLQPALRSGLIEMTIPNKPTSGKQKYRKSKKGKELNL